MYSVSPGVFVHIVKCHCYWIFRRNNVKLSLPSFVFYFLFLQTLSDTETCSIKSFSLFLQNSVTHFQVGRIYNIWQGQHKRMNWTNCMYSKKTEKRFKLYFVQQWTKINFYIIGICSCIHFDVSLLKLHSRVFRCILFFCNVIKLLFLSRKLLWLLFKTFLDRFFTEFYIKSLILYMINLVPFKWLWCKMHKWSFTDILYIFHSGCMIVKVYNLKWKYNW